MAESVCVICKKENINPFSNPYGALHHYDMAHKNICAFCNQKAFTDGNSRNEHMSKVHSMYPCDICWRVFTVSDYLATHKNHPKTHAYRCNECAKECASNAEWWVHMFVKHAGVCIICSSNLDNIYSEKFHRDAHLKETHNMFPCNDCWAVYYSETALGRHYQCEHSVACDKTASINALDTGKDSPTSNEIKCTFCLELFPTEAQLKLHYNSKHLFTCCICDKVFKTALEHAAHYNAVHNVQCFVCNVFFTSESQLQLHNNVEHRVECAVCDKVFFSQDPMKEHFRLAHQLSCDLCDKICLTLGELQLHCNVVHHVGGDQQSCRDREHLCSVCNGEFRTEGDLVEHYENLHINE